jgi:ABC-type sulfate transport system permease subunit
MAATLGAGSAPRSFVAEWLQRRFGASWRSLLVLAAIAGFLLLLLIIPVGTVFVTAFRDGDGTSR